MKIIKSTDAIKYKNADSCIAFEYETGEGAINMARVEINGRYPIEGSAVNKAVEELIYIENGKGEVHVNDNSILLEAGDVVSIHKNEAVWWEGKMKLIIACAPAWTKDQYELTS